MVILKLDAVLNPDIRTKISTNIACPPECINIFSNLAEKWTKQKEVPSARSTPIWGQGIIVIWLRFKIRKCSFSNFLQIDEFDCSWTWRLKTGKTQVLKETRVVKLFFFVIWDNARGRLVNGLLSSTDKSDRPRKLLFFCERNC